MSAVHASLVNAS